jgi:signal transduction histidine kinase
VQESLTNAARHAGPDTTVTVRVSYNPDDLSLEIADDGCAPAPRGAHRHGGGRGPAGAGIPGMRERAAALGGQLEAGPRPGRGFRVHARLPTGGAQ